MTFPKCSFNSWRYDSVPSPSKSFTYQIVGEIEADIGQVDDVHWHPWDSHIYLLEGEYEHYDATGETVVVEPGDYQFTAARELHSSKVTKSVKLILGTSKSFEDDEKTNFSPDEL